MKVLNLYIKYITKFNEVITKYVICWLIYVLIAVMTNAIVMRYFFHRPVAWGLDMSWMLYSAFIFLGGAYALIHDAHVSVDVLYNRFSPKIRALLSILCYLVLFFPAFYILTRYTWSFALSAYAYGEVSPYGLWKPVVWPIKMVTFISMGLLLLQGIAKFFEQIIILWKGDTV